MILAKIILKLRTMQIVKYSVIDFQSKPLNADSQIKKIIIIFGSIYGKWTH